MRRHWPLLLGTLTVAALSACATGPLASGSAAVERRVAYVADAVAAVGAATRSAGQPAAPGAGAQAGASSAAYLAGPAVSIALGAPTTVSGPGVGVDGSTVTITEAGTYRLSGTVADGRVVVQTADDAAVTLVLDGARISSASGAPLAVMSDTDLTLVLADGSDNFLSDAASYVLPAGADEPNGALFARGDLTIAGAGALTIDARFQHGIRGKDDVTVAGGSLTITAKGDAVNSNNDLTVDGGQLTIAAGDDALHADLKLTINDGRITIGRSYEAIESEAITINGGTIYATSTNDAINAAAAGAAAPGGRAAPGAGAGATAPLLTINGGYLVLDAGAGDGLDANGSISMTGGTVIVHGASTNMESPIDYDGSFKLTGGTIVAAGSAGMAQAPGATSTQNSVMVTFPAVQPAGTLVHIAGQDGKDVLTFAPPKAFQSLVLSSPALETGATYRVSTGGGATGAALDGLYAAGSQNAGAEFASFTVAGPVTNVGTAAVARRR